MELNIEGFDIEIEDLEERVAPSATWDVLPD